MRQHVRDCLKEKRVEAVDGNLRHRRDRLRHWMSRLVRTVQDSPSHVMRPYRLVWSDRLARFIPAGRRSKGMSRQLPPGGMWARRSMLTAPSFGAAWSDTVAALPRIMRWYGLGLPLR